MLAALLSAEQAGSGLVSKHLPQAVRPTVLLPHLLLGRGHSDLSTHHPEHLGEGALV